MFGEPQKLFFLALTSMDNCMVKVRAVFQRFSPDSIRTATHEKLIQRSKKYFEKHKKFRFLFNFHNDGGLYGWDKTGI